MLKCKDAMKEYNDVFAYGSRFVDFTLRFPVSYKKSLQRDRVVYYDHRIGELQGAAMIAVCEKERADAIAAAVGSGSGTSAAGGSGGGSSSAAAGGSGGGSSSAAASIAAASGPVAFPDLSEMKTILVTLSRTPLLY